MIKCNQNAKTILDKLRNKHSEDIFVPECKAGPSQFVGCPRMDAWVMKKSWVNPLAIAYEIKVSRSDFLGDKKWNTYLPYCNELYFVCPWKLIMPDEVSGQVGLIWSSKTGSRLFTKKKAQYREVDIPIDLFKYVLMSRVKITKCDRFSYQDYWHNWLAQKKQDVNFGHLVGKKIQETIKKEIKEARAKNETLKKQMKRYETIRSIIKELGFNPDTYFNTWNVHDKLKDLNKVVPSELWTSLDGTIYALTRFQKTLKSLMEPQQEKGNV